MSPNCADSAPTTTRIAAIDENGAARIRATGRYARRRLLRQRGGAGPRAATDRHWLDPSDFRSRPSDRPIGPTETGQTGHHPLGAMHRRGIHSPRLAGHHRYSALGPTTVRAVSADDSPDKRQRLIEELLDSPGYAAWWATRFSDWTGNSEEQLNNVLPIRNAASRLWYEWLRSSARCEHALRRNHRRHRDGPKPPARTKLTSSTARA